MWEPAPRALCDPAIQAFLHLGLALLLARAAWHKWRDPAAFRRAVAGYQLLPARAVGPVAAALGLAEAALAGALVWTFPSVGDDRVAALGGALLVAVYAAAMAVNLRRGRLDLDCGCTGPGAHRPIHAALVARNVLLVVAFGAAALPTEARAWHPLDAPVVAAALAIAALLYSVTEHPAFGRTPA